MQSNYLVQQRAPQVFNVKDYGATGNGTTDDTAAIQATITTAQNASGGQVFFPSGSYLISSTLSITANNIQLVGAGRSSLIIAASGFTASSKMIWVQAPATGYRYGFALRDIVIQNTAVSSLTGVQLDSTYWASLDRADVEGIYATNVYLNGSSSYFGAYTRIRDCHFGPVPNGTQSGGTGLLTNNHEWISCDGVTFNWFNTAGGIGAKVQNDSISFTDCTFDVCDTSIFLAFSRMTTIHGCHFDRGYTRFIYSNGAQECRIFGCDFQGFSGTGSQNSIYLDNTSNNNTFDSNNWLPGTTWAYALYEAVNTQSQINRYNNNNFGGLPIHRSWGSFINNSNTSSNITLSTQFNVMDYGAAGDGATDDTTEIQNAITACQNAGGGIVFLPAGTYVTSASLVISSDKVTIAGANWGTIIKPASGATFDVIKTSIPSTVGTSGYVRNYISIKDLMIDCSNMTGTVAGQGNGIHYYGVRYGTIERVYILKCPNWAILLDGDNTTPGQNFGYDNLIWKCVFDQCNAGCFQQNCEANDFVENRFKWAGTACAAAQPAFGTQDTTAMHLRLGSGYAYVNGNIFGKGGTYTTEAIRCSNSGPCRISNNRFDQVRNQAVVLNGGNHVFIGNALGSPGSANTGVPAIQMGSSHNRVIGNSFDTTAGGSNFSYAVAENGGPFTDNLIIGNELLAGTSGTVSVNSASLTKIISNGGYVPPWETQNVRDYGATGNGTTDDTTAVQNAINAANAAGGGIVYFPAGTYIIAGITLYSFVHLRGAGIGATTLKLKNGANTDLLWGGATNAGYINLAASSGTSNTGGLANFGIYEMTLDGNKANQTAAVADPTTAITTSGALTTGGALLASTSYTFGYTYTTAAGETKLVSATTAYTPPAGTNTNQITLTAPALPTSATGVNWYCTASGDAAAKIGLVANTAGVTLAVTTAPSSWNAAQQAPYINRTTIAYPLRVYGYGYILQDLRVKNGYSGGILSDWNGGANSPGNDSMEAQWVNVKIHDCNNWGMEIGGPHDSQITNVIVYNVGGGIHVAPNAGGFIGADVHVWGIQSGFAAFLIEGGGCAFSNGTAECPPAIGVVLMGSYNRFDGTIMTASGSTSVGGIQIGQSSGQTPINGTINQSGGLTTGVQCINSLLDLSINMPTTTGYGISYVNDGGYNDIRATIYMTSASATQLTSGASPTSRRTIIVHGVGYDGTVPKGGETLFYSTSTSGFRVKGGTTPTDLFNIDTYNAKAAFTNAMKLQFFSDNYTTQKIGVNEDNAGSAWFGGYIASGQSASAAAIATGGTITTASVGVARVAPTAAVTGVILQAGTKAGQQVTVVNESAFSVTFAASGTSFVVDGASDVIAATSARAFVWDSGTALWYRLQ